LSVEQGIAIQRLRLLRLVAGLLLSIAVLSVAPFSMNCRRHVRGWVFSFLTRAESAAQALVIAQAAVVARRRGLRFASQSFFGSGEKPVAEPALSDELLPSFGALRQRLRALRALLENLPRRGLRLLRRVIGERAGQGDERAVFYCDPPLHAFRLATDPIERPPDKGSVLRRGGYFPPSRTRAGGVCRGTF